MRYPRKGDFIGGITATIIPFPWAMALGAMIFAPLGPKFITMGIAAGMIAIFVSNFSTAFLGSMPIMHNAPFSLSSFMLLAALQSITTHLGDMSSEENVLMAVTLLFFIVFMSGAFQCLFGIFRVGNLARYIPYPVLSGLLNGSALLIILAQIRPILGLSVSINILDISRVYPLIQWLTLIVGIVTCIAVWLGPKINKKIPAPLYGLIAGSSIYYTFISLGFSDKLCSVLGTVSSVLPSLRYGATFSEFFKNTIHSPLILELMPLAIGVAAINSLSTLVVCSAGDNIRGERSNSNKELFGQGFSNMLNGLLGGISTAGSMPSTLSNYKYGGRTLYSRAISGIFALLILLFLHPLIAKIPHAVLAGLLIMIAINAADAWSFHLLFRIKSVWTNKDKTAFGNIFIVSMVTLTVIMFGIFRALGVGLAISIISFIIRMGKSGIRRELQADTFHSNTKRGKKEMEILEKEGESIVILELEGALFFGTAEKVATRVEEYIKDTAKFILLDFKKINEIDSTGAKIIKQLKKKCDRKNITIYLSAIWGKSSSFSELENFFSKDQLQACCYCDLETSLSVAEDKLLDDILGKERYTKEISLEELEVFELFEKEEIEYIKKYLIKKTYKPNEQIFKKGETGDSVYFIMKGRTHIFLESHGSRQRISTLCRGTTVGEMALIEKRPRSADVFASEEVVCLQLTTKELNEITQENSIVALKILKGIAKELSTRLRISNRIQVHLKN